MCIYVFVAGEPWAGAVSVDVYNGPCDLSSRVSTHATGKEL